MASNMSIMYLPFSDHIEAPQFLHGAMENWGLVTYAEDLFSYEVNVSSSSDYEVIAIVVTHEVVHQVCINNALK